MSTKMQQQVSCNVTPTSVTFLATLSDKQLQLKTLGEWVKKHREIAEISQESASELAGLSRYQWIRIENGQSGTKRETLIQIAKVIKADVNETLKRGGFSELFTSADQNINQSEENTSSGKTQKDKEARARELLEQSFGSNGKPRLEDIKQVLDFVDFMVAKRKAEQETH